MAIAKRIKRSGAVSYQVKCKGFDGKWITQTFSRKADAESKEAEIVSKKRSGNLVSNLSHRLTIDEFFKTWDEQTRKTNVSQGWRKDQIKYYNDYVSPVIGKLKLRIITPAHIAQILSRMTELGRAPQTCLHIYNLLNKVFGDAIEMYELIYKNPVKKALKPKLIKKEAPYLRIEEIKKLLTYVRGKPYGVPIWLGAMCGLRSGETIALKWADIDWTNSTIIIRRNFVRKENRFQDFPKEKKWRRLTMPNELADYLKEYQSVSRSEYVAAQPGQTFVLYEHFQRTLQRYCAELRLPQIGTHGLRHSSTEILRHFGATMDDINRFFNHSDYSVTERYVHDKGERVHEIAKVIRLFPESEMSFPKVDQSQN